MESDPTATPGQVRAAGGVVVRERGGTREVVLVHRARYDDWSLPKGKVDPGETFEAAALREVQEETALDCVLLDELESVRYRDAHGRAKVVRYWLMRPVGGCVETRAPDHEIDAVEWVTFDEAERVLTYIRDRKLVLAAAGLELSARDGEEAE